MNEKQERTLEEEPPDCSSSALLCAPDSGLPQTPCWGSRLHLANGKREGGRRDRWEARQLPAPPTSQCPSRTTALATPLPQPLPPGPLAQASRPVSPQSPVDGSPCAASAASPPLSARVTLTSPLLRNLFIKILSTGPNSVSHQDCNSRHTPRRTYSQGLRKAS